MSAPRRRDVLRQALWAAPWLALTPLARADAPTPARGDLVAWPASLPLVGGGEWRPTPGQATIVVFWSTTCGFCQRHNQHVEKLHRSLAGRPAMVLGASRDRDPAVVQAYMARHGLSFPMTLAWRGLATALSSRRIIPLTVTVDRDGRLQEVIPGEMFESDVLGLARWAG